MVAACCAVGIAFSASGDLIGFDVSGTVYTGPGILDTSSRTWESGSTFELDGETITLTFGSHSTGSADADIDLFDQYYHNNGSGRFGVVLTGLDPLRTYDLVLYGAQSAVGGRGALFEIQEGDGGLHQQASTTGDQQSSFAEGVNYTRFTGLVPDTSSGDDRIRWTVENGPEGIGIFNGFEISSSAVIPEPTTCILSGLGLLMVLAAGRRGRRGPAV